MGPHRISLRGTFCSTVAEFVISAQLRSRFVLRQNASTASDAFVFVTPEYNSGTSPVLKKAADWVYPEWNRIAAAFVSYGSAMCARSVQQMRETAIDTQLDQPAAAMIDDLVGWAAAFKASATPDLSMQSVKVRA